MREIIESCSLHCDTSVYQMNLQHASQSPEARYRPPLRTTHSQLVCLSVCLSVPRCLSRNFQEVNFSVSPNVVIFLSV